MKLFAILSLSITGTLLLVAPGAQAALADSAALCETSATSQPFSYGAKVAWGRSLEIQVQDPSVSAWEIWQGDQLRASGDASADPWIFESVRNGEGLRARWANTFDTCYFDEPLAILMTAGTAGRFKAKIDKSHPGEPSISFESAETACENVRIGPPGVVEVRRGTGKWIRRPVPDMCFAVASNRRNWPLGPGLEMRHFTPDDAAEVEPYMYLVPTAKKGPRKESVLVRFRGQGVNFSRRILITRVDRPDRKVWAGTDEYWDYCVIGSQKIHTENGKKFCWKTGVDEVRVALRLR
ncbi:MAG: hypothetical protein JWM90_1942 [Thermoleophilia bacterium]|nr:hypothetical protein [Thermoleophilia bacterium]